MIPFKITKAPEPFEDFVVENINNNPDKGYKTKVHPAILELTLDEPTHIKQVELENNGTGLIEILGVSGQENLGKPEYKVV